MNRSILRRFTLAVSFIALLSLIGALGASASPVIEDDPGTAVQLSRVGMAYQLVDAVFNRGDAAAAAALVSDDAVIHTAHGDYTGPQGLLDSIARIRSLYPDAHFEVTSISVSDTGLTLEWTMTATRFVSGPASETLHINAEIPFAATITVDDDQIAGMTESNAGPEPVVINTGHMQDR